MGELMGYHPETLAFSFPPYPKGGSVFAANAPYPWTFGRLLYSLSPWIGVDIWHIDPEKRGTGNRTDDSCGWFDRTPGSYADAVAYVLGDQSTMFEIERAIATRVPVTHHGKYTYPRMSMSETLAVCALVAGELELRRWWNGQRGNGGAHASWLRRAFTREREVGSLAARLAVNPLDNLSSIDTPEDLVRLMAASLNRHFRPWWRHPRWHVHHWQVNLHIIRNLRRMFEPCATCHRPLGFGYSPVQDGGGVHHAECVGQSVCAAQAIGT